MEENFEKTKQATETGATEEVVARIPKGEKFTFGFYFIGQLIMYGMVSSYISLFMTESGIAAFVGDGVDATVLQVRRGDDGLVTISAAGAKSGNGLIVLQQRGQMVACGYDTLAVRESDLPAGVVQAMLFDEEMRCLSERLFFAGGSSLSEPTVATDRETYTDRAPVKVNVDLSSLPSNPSNYAVSVIDGQACEPSEGNIFSNLLLQSELRGRINQPNYYFDQGDTIDRKQRLHYLDLLMLHRGITGSDGARLERLAQEAGRRRKGEPDCPASGVQFNDVYRLTGRVCHQHAAAARQCGLYRYGREHQGEKTDESGTG